MYNRNFQETWLNQLFLFLTLVRSHLSLHWTLICHLEIKWWLMKLALIRVTCCRHVGHDQSLRNRVAICGGRGRGSILHRIPMTCFTKKMGGHKFCNLTHKVESLCSYLRDKRLEQVIKRFWASVLLFFFFRVNNANLGRIL